MTHNLQDLADKRDALLLAEVAAWLHMLGKFHEDFLRGEYNLDVKIPVDLTQTFPELHQILEDSVWLEQAWNSLDIDELKSGSIGFSDFIKTHRSRSVQEGLLKLMWDAHGRGSGIEKGILNRFATPQQNLIFLSTAFGTEKNAIDLNDIKMKRHKFYDFLNCDLPILKNIFPVSSFDWAAFRDKFIAQVKCYFRQTVAETRHPLSDVSLFDQTSASVAFLKASIAQILLVGWKDPVTTDINQKYYWRFLKVNLDGLAFWGNSVKIGDLLARKDLMRRAFDKVKKVLEEDYPLGLQVYRDENSSIFIVPDIQDLLDAKVSSVTTLEQNLQEIANSQFEGEACWTLELSEKTRNTLKFGKLATSTSEQYTASPESIKSHWNLVGSKRDICPVCNLRPLGLRTRALKLKVCNICSKRRTRRAQAWKKGNYNTANLSTTIWIDEVADTNGRLALIVGHFELESWLTGELFNSMVILNPERHCLKDSKKNDQQYQFEYQILLDDIQKTIHRNQFVRTAPLLRNLVLKDDRGSSFNNFYDLQVTDTDLVTGKQGKDPNVLALAMMRQNPSFARVRRVWETTREFWKGVLADVPDLQLPKVKGRLIITIDESEISRLRLVNFSTYDLIIKNVKLSVIRCDNQLITVDNLCYVAKQLHAFSDARGNDKPNLYSDSEQAADFVRRQLLSQRQVSIEEPTGYGTPNNPLGRLDINDETPNNPLGRLDINDDNNDGISVTSNLTEYSPVIPILAEPSTFIALVPANNVDTLESLNIIETIKTKYDREMGKVRNRLPLHLGVVYFDRRTPLRAALDAGRQMLTYKSDSQTTWEVKSISIGPLPNEKQELANGTQQFAETVTLELTKGDNHTITWHVPNKMGDGTTEDVWYPYVFLETDDDDNTVLGKYSRAIKSLRPGTTEPCWLVHAKCLIKGDRIYFTPSTFDFEYLDSTARRFEIYYDESGRRPRKTRPFYLEDLERFAKLWGILKQLETSQRHQVIHTIEATRELWYGQDWQQSKNDCVFRRFVEDTLATASWPKDKRWGNKPEADRQQLVDAGVRGELADLAELHMEILKER